MTKKLFKEQVLYQNYCIGFGSRGFHAFYYDYLCSQDKNENWRGYKYLIYCRKESLTKKGLFDIFYQFINGNIENLPYYVCSKIAITNNERFKISISIKN